MTAKARLGKTARRIAVAKRRIAKAGATTITLRLSKAARKRLRAHKPLTVVVRIKAPGSRLTTMRVRLKR